MQTSQQVVQGDELVQGQNRAGTDLLGLSESSALLHSPKAGWALPLPLLAGVPLL